MVARRLSDDPDTRVLLLEAGPDPKDFWVDTPAGMARVFKHDRFNWNFYSEPMPTLRDRKLFLPRGKALGGSSAINGMVYIRGDRRDFDNWAALGNPGWTWNDVLPYFLRSEQNTREGSQFHSQLGEMAVSDPDLIHPSIHAFLDAAENCGLRKLDDLNTGDQDGAGILQHTIRKGKRETTYGAFVKPVLGRRNLTVRANTRVARVLLDGQEATGVEIIEGGKRTAIAASREVILCGGAFSSPQTLMLSGIGDGDELKAAGVPVAAHLPGVGKNLQDHFVLRVQAYSTRESSFNLDLLGWRKFWHGAKYLLTKRGYLALGSSTAAAFVKSSPEMEYADLELSFRPMTFAYTASGVVAVHDYNAVSGSVYRVRPKSRGHVALRSADPMSDPAIHPNFLSDPEDVAASISGIRQLRRILGAAPMAERLRDELVPGAEVETDEQLTDYMEREGHCAFHPAGTCKMGQDDMAVVDERLRVRGIGRLRVIDASIMPVVTSGNTNAPAIMIGEKGADMVRADAVAARPVTAG